MTPERTEFDALLRSTATPGSLPPGLTDRITTAAVRDFRFRRNVRRAGWATAAAAVLVAGWFAIPTADRHTDNQAPVARMIDPFREADAAFATLSRSAADRVTSTAPALPATDILPDPLPLAAAPTTAALPTFDPVTSTATRAVGRFIQDLGSAAGTH